MDEQVAAAAAAQVRHAAGVERERGAGLGAGLDGDLLLAVERLQRHGGAEHRRRHRDLQVAVQVVAVTLELRVFPLVDLDVEVAGRAAGRADLALAVQPDPHAVLDPGRHLDRQRAPAAHPALAAALPARARDDRAVAAAAGAGARGDHLAEERPGHLLDLAGAPALLAGLGMGARSRALALAGLAEHGGVDGDLPLHAESGLGQVEVDAQQRVGAGTHPGARARGWPRRRRRTRP